MQSAASVEAARDFVAHGCEVVAPGSLKADLRRRELPEAQARDLQSWLERDGLPLVAVGSTTDPEEEALALDAFLALRHEVPCRLLLAPRDLRRLGDTLPLLAARGLAVGRRSEGGSGDVLLLDTFGELATAYGSCRAAYVGGFRGKGGGHNVLEPLEHGVPVAYGPNRGHFEAEQKLLEEAGAGARIADAPQLAAFWLRFLQDEAARVRVGAAGRAVLDANRGAVARTVDALLRLL